jgi:hypothetical protein
VNLLGDNTNTITTKMEILIDARKEVALEVNTENYVYVAVSLPECMAKSLHKDS